MRDLKGLHHGALPLNARVTVDYRRKRVEFSYPSPTTAKKAKRFAFMNMFAVALLPWFMINGFLFVAYMLVTGTLALASTGLPPMDAHQLLLPLLVVVAELAYMFLPPLVFAWWVTKDEERLRTLLPRVNAVVIESFRGHYEAIFRRTKRRVVEIPVFDNIVLTYKATGEFGRNLERIEIKEHPVTYQHSWFRHKSRAQDKLWRAIFMFKKDCRRGYLKVAFV